MTSSNFYIWVTVRALLPVIGFWIGVIALRQTRPGLIWWFLLSGTSLMTAGIIASSIAMVMADRANHSSGSLVTLQIVSAASTCAWILFAVSFAIHSFSMVRLAKRAQELEGLCAAMSAEMQRNRERSPGGH